MKIVNTSISIWNELYSRKMEWMEYKRNNSFLHSQDRYIYHSRIFPFWHSLHTAQWSEWLCCFIQVVNSFVSFNPGTYCYKNSSKTFHSRNIGKSNNQRKDAATHQTSLLSQCREIVVRCHEQSEWNVKIKCFFCYYYDTFLFVDTSIFLQRLI